MYLILSSRVDQAIRLSSNLHRNQTRQDGNRTPYSSHLFSVAMMLVSITEDEDVIIAGLMHDSLEDVPGYTLERLQEDCGSRVAEIVRHVTEPLDANKEGIEQLPWLTRKEAYLEVLRSGEKESALVSLADKIHNTESFLEDAKREGEIFLARFHSSLRNKLWFHEEVLKITTEKIGEDHILVKRFSEANKDFKELVESLE